MMGWIFELRGQGRDKAGLRCLPGLAAALPFPLASDLIVLEVIILTIHDLRRTVSTNLTSERCGVTPFIRSKVLGHLDGGGGALVSSTHYDSNTYIAEKRRALEAWSTVLKSVVAGL